jgi:cysteine synthase A
VGIAPSILEAVGNTPLVRLNKITSPSSEISVKLEYYNPTGSYKDRMAMSMVEEAEKEGLLKPGHSVVEYTGGNTGSSLAFVCAVKGYRAKLVTSDAFSEEKIRMMRAFGADITIVPSKDGKVTPDLVPRMMEKTKELADQPNTYWTNQLYNKHQLKGHNKMGEEIIAQTGGKLHAFVAAAGTAGCVMGVAQVLKTKLPGTRVFVVEPAESAVISNGVGGAHHIEGIGLGFIPPLLQKELFDGVIAVKEAEAKSMAQRLAREEGIFAGTSTGANVVAAIEAARRLGDGSRIVTVAVDTGLKYLWTEPFFDR